MISHTEIHKRATSGPNQKTKYEAYKSYIEGERAFDIQDYDYARTCFADAATLDPELEYYRARLGLAIFYSDINNYESCKRALKIFDLISINSLKISDRSAPGLCAQAVGDLEKAVRFHFLALKSVNDVSSPGLSRIHNCLTGIMEEDVISLRKPYNYCAPDYDHTFHFSCTLIDGSGLVDVKPRVRYFKKDEYEVILLTFDQQEEFNSAKTVIPLLIVTFFAIMFNHDLLNNPSLIDDQKLICIVHIEETEHESHTLKMLNALSSPECHFEPYEHQKFERITNYRLLWNPDHWVHHKEKFG